MNNTPQKFDIIIVGAGLAGASLALALGQLGLRVALVEAVPRPTAQQLGYDERSITLAYGSSRIFAGLGLWPQLLRDAVAIRQIHISERGRFGATRLNSVEEGVDALGYVINARLLGNALFTALDALPSVTWLRPARLAEIKSTPESIQAKIIHDGAEHFIQAQLLIGADGVDSSVRSLLGIGVTAHDYRQTAIVTTLASTQPHNHTAYERFTASGAIALLPNPAGRFGLVWMHSNDSVQHALNLSDADFLSQAQQHFGARLGTLQNLCARRAYQLRLVCAQQQVAARAVLIGNAAHSLHPIGGQGFNLGLRDIATLAQLLADAQRSHVGHADLGATALLEQYRTWRESDQQRVVRFTDSLVRVFEASFPLLAAVRPLGFLATSLCPPLKHSIARSALGLAGRLPRVARGLPL